MGKDQDSPDPYTVHPFEKHIHQIYKSISAMEVRLARIEERISPVAKIVYGMVSLALTALGGAVIALVLR